MTVTPLDEVVIELARVGVATRDALIMNVIESDASTVVEGGHSTDAELEATDKPKLATLVNISEGMITNNVQPMRNGNYAVLIDRLQANDMIQNDPLLQQYMTVGMTNSPYRTGLIPDILGLEFDVIT